MNPEQFYVSCPRGLESALADELRELRCTVGALAHAGVSVEGSIADAYRINLHSRIASRVLWRIGGRSYRNEQDIYDAAMGIDWPSLFDVGRTIAVKVDAQRSPLRSLDFIALRVKDAICDRFRAATGRRPDVDTRTPDMRVHVFLDAQQATLYVDTSGKPLFQRGYREFGGDAPLRQNLAAGLLRLAQWNPAEALLDPMCGSATILIEAGLQALNIAPGIAREFAFEKLHNFDAPGWGAQRQDARARAIPTMPLAIYGSDLYGSVLDQARANIAAAGLGEVIELNQANALEISAPAESGVVITNPPYGVRIGESATLAQFYPRFGDVLKRKFPGWRAYILSADMQLPKLIRLKTTRRIPLYNGALDCRLFEYKLVAGSMRESKD